MERRAKDAGFSPPDLDELLAEFPDREQAMDVLTLLIEQGQLLRVAEFIVQQRLSGQKRSPSSCASNTAASQRRNFVRQRKRPASMPSRCWSF
jgi:hypothetical protein